MKKNLILFIALITLLSCETTVNVDLPPIQSKIAVNCLFTPDSTFKVYVYKTLAVLDRKDFSIIANATVTLFEDGIEKEIIEENQEGVYRSKYLKASPEKIYSIKVSAPGYEEATAESSIPSTLPISSFDFNDSAGIDDNGDYYQAFTLTLADPVNKENFYAFQATKTRKNILKKPNENTYDTIKYNTPILLSENFTPIEAGPNGMALFSDNLYNGKSFSQKINLISPYGNYYYGNATNSIKNEYTFLIKFVSKDYYEYFRKLDDHLNNRDGGIFSGEAVIMYSNIKNGYGIFAGYNQTSLTLKK